jgi:hypothetical protein
LESYTRVEWTYGYEWSEMEGIHNFGVETRTGNVHLEDQKGDIMKIIRQVSEKCVLRERSYWNWNVKTGVIPVITGATGTISKSFRQYASNIPGNHEVRELQKTAILGTAHILRKVLSKSTIERTRELEI